MPDYIPVPVGAAIELADKCAKSMVVILAYDPEHGLTHCTTYGRTPQEKRIAANVGEACTKMLGADLDLKRVFEDFRAVDASERAAENEQAIRLLAWCLEMGAVHWEQCPEYIEALALVRKKRGGL